LEPTKTIVQRKILRKSNVRSRQYPTLSLCGGMSVAGRSLRKPKKGGLSFSTLQSSDRFGHPTPVTKPGQFRIVSELVGSATSRIAKVPLFDHEKPTRIIPR
jgi:hypothetical protein